MPRSIRRRDRRNGIRVDRIVDREMEYHHSIDNSTTLIRLAPTPTDNRGANPSIPHESYASTLRTHAPFRGTTIAAGPSVPATAGSAVRLTREYASVRLTATACFSDPLSQRLTCTGGIHAPALIKTSTIHARRCADSFPSFACNTLAVSIGGEWLLTVNLVTDRGALNVYRFTWGPELDSGKNSSAVKEFYSAIQFSTLW